MWLGITPLDCGSFRSELSRTLHLFFGPFSSLRQWLSLPNRPDYWVCSKWAKKSTRWTGSVLLNSFSGLVQQLRLDGDWMAAEKGASKTSVWAGRECCLTPVLWSSVCAEGTSMFQGHIHRQAEFVLSFATTDCCCFKRWRLKIYYVPEATVTAVKTEDKTMAKGKTDKHRESNSGPEGEGRKKRGGKVSGAGLAFFPLISCNSPNHNDRRRAIDGESERGKGEIWANGKKGGGGGCMKGKRNWESPPPKKKRGTPVKCFGRLGWKRS